MPLKMIKEEDEKADGGIGSVIDTPGEIHYFFFWDRKIRSIPPPPLKKKKTCQIFTNFCAANPKIFLLKQK